MIVESTVLNNFRCAQGAEFWHGERNGCLKGTREPVLDEIELWTRNFAKPPVYWLNGLAGTGKTTIAQTIAERTFADGQLGASFFCSRDFEDRRNLHFIFPTLAVQLARKYPSFRSLFIPLVQSNPGVAHESLYNQLRKLIVQPLKESDISTVIIIDALDECKDEEPASAILSVLGQFVSEIPKVKFFITGRPEPRIREGFRLSLLADATNVFVLHEVEPNQVGGDIMLFFGHKFSEIVRRRRGLGGWPAIEQLDTLCKRAAGLFVYAVATVKFVDKLSGNPRKQLDLLLQSPESSVREAKTKLKADTTLDSLYTSILKGAFGDEDDPDGDPEVRSVLGAMVLAADPISPSTIAILLDLDTEDVFPLLSSTQSLLIFQEDVNHPVRPFHKSFPDFITDPDRCSNQRFHISPPNHHLQLLIGCLNLMDRTLEKNMCRLPEAVANSDVGDLKERIEQYIDPALQYACRSWHTHLADRHISSGNTDEITSALHRFLERKFLFWLEVVSVLGVVRNAVDALQAAVNWLEVRQDSIFFLPQVFSDLNQMPTTLDLANDCHRFVSTYFEIIRVSSPHIYHSALMLAPKTSIVRKLYESYSQNFVKIVHGVPESWDSNTAATTLPFGIGEAVWSPCNKFIAISSQDTIRVDLLDSTTLQRLQSLGSPWEGLSCIPALAFSPDGRMLTYSGQRARPGSGNSIIRGQEVLIVTWDVQTGRMISAIEWKGMRQVAHDKHLITYSMEGEMVAILFEWGTGIVMCIFNVVSGVYMHQARLRPTDRISRPCFSQLWTHGESIRFATAKSEKITIWEVGFTLGAPNVEVETLPGPNNIRLAARFKFLPASRRAAFCSYFEVSCWNSQDSVSLLYQTGVEPYPPMTFSSDGRFFAYPTAGSGIYLWKESPTGYTLHGKLSPGGKDPIPLISPSGEAIIVFCGSMVQLWDTRSVTTTLSSTSVQLSQRTEDFILDFFPDRSLAVVMRQKENTMIVIDLESGSPWLTIGASMVVYGFRVIGNTIVAIGCEKVITWNLPGGNHLPDMRLNTKDSTQTIILSRPLVKKYQHVTAASMSLNFHHIVFVVLFGDTTSASLYLYNASTGKYLGKSSSTSAGIPWFAPGGDGVWCAIGGSRAVVWALTGDSLDHKMVVDDLEHELGECPWRSSHGYQVTNEGWVLGLDGKRLLMLPPPWQSDPAHRVWNGKFLALLHATLTKAVVIQLEP